MRVAGAASTPGRQSSSDLLCSQNDELADIYQGGLAWIDATMRRRDGTRFVDASAPRQTALLDALVSAERAERGGRAQTGDLGPGVSFFNWVRRMTVDAYYTSPIGIADLQYQGNTSMTRYTVPQEVIDFVNRRIEER